MAKRALCLLLALVTLFSLSAPAFAEEKPVAAEEVVTEEPVIEPEEVVEDVAAEPKTVAATSGKCGENVQWSLSGGTLTISGSGKMKDYSYNVYAPWSDQREAIQKVVIKDGVTSIGDYAFANCESLTSVTIPGSVTSIGGHAFSWCLVLEDVMIPESVTSIGDWAFEYCCALTDIAIPTGVTRIGEHMFFYCGNLKSVTIPDSVTSIGTYAFFYCMALTDVTIPESVTNIGRIAFESCEALTSVTIPASVTSIGEWAFEDCKSLASITIQNPRCTINDSYGYGKTLGIPGKTVVYGYDGSTAQTYANKYGYTFKLIKETPTPVPKLAAPTVTISGVSNGIQVSWTAVSGSPRYMVYYKEGNGGWKKIGTTTSTTYTRAAKYLKNGTTYTFTVRCCANDKKTLLGPYKASNSITYIANLAAPTVTISKVTDGIKVTWNKVTGSPRYMVYYKEGTGSWKKIGTTTATTYTRAAKYLKNNVTYTFTVRCCANDKKTMLSSFKASNSITYIANLAAPTVTISKVADGIKVSWNKVAGSPRYMVYYKEGSGGWKQIGTTTSTTYTRAAKYLKNGVKYTFTVRCCANDKKTMLSGYKASNSLTYTAPAAVPAETHSGTCGKNGSSAMKWTVTANGKTKSGYTTYSLTISGKGEMEEYAAWSADYSAPWDDYIVTDIQVKSGVTNISGNAFWGAGYRGDSSDEAIPAAVSIADTVTHIEFQAFGCSKLAEVTIPASVKTIESSAFTMTSVDSITIQNRNCVIGDGEDTLGGPGTTVIKGYKGSTAESYAKKYGFTFEPLT